MDHGPVLHVFYLQRGKDLFLVRERHKGDDLLFSDAQLNKAAENLPRGMVGSRVISINPI
jgi:hypothetical protein